MSLDQNLFTLLLTPNTSDSVGTAVDLTDPFGLVHYRKRRISGQVYKIEVNDPISEALLASATAPSATTKHKTLELYNPSKVVELKYTGTLSFRWSFKWEEHEFEWRREECFIIRKPDPPVLVAVTKEPPGKIKTASVQLLDYNLNRFDIEDRKGLEIIILTALLTFQDASDTYHDPNAVTPVPTPSTTPPVLKVLTDMSPWKSSGSTPSAPPPPPPRPAPKKGVERVAELQQGRGEANEVTVVEEGAVKDYAKHCSRLLQDDAMLFISVRSSDATQVPKVLQVVEETKRTRHKGGDPELHQYVLYDTEKPLSHKGPRVINLDDGKGKSSGYSPPTSLVVHLSKIDMPELRPRQASSSRTQTSLIRAGEREPDTKAESKKERKEREKREKERKEKEKKDKDKSPKQKSPVPNSNSPPASSSRLQRPRSQHFHTLPDPATYAAPPPSFARPPPQHGGRPSYRQSMYGSLNAYYDQQSHDQSQPPTVPLPSSTGRFGRFLGGR